MRTRSGGWISAPVLLAALALAGPAAATGEGTLPGMSEGPTADRDPGTEAPVADRDPGMPEAPVADPDPGKPEAPMGHSGRVARATFTTLVTGREPQDEVERLTNDHNRVVFFTDLRGFAGRSVTHVWEHDGAVMARVPFAVGGDRWRVYSTKNLEPSWTGDWTVKVVDEQGKVLHSEAFSYVSAPPDATATADATGTTDSTAKADATETTDSTAKADATETTGSTDTPDATDGEDVTLPASMPME